MRLLLILLLAVATSPALGQAVYRCRDSAGTSVFTDRPCRFADAAPITPPEPIDGSRAPLPEATPDADAPPTIPQAAIGCPGPDPVALAKALQQAVLARDLNALAGLVDWDGAGRHEARRVLGRLQALIDAGADQPRLETPGWSWRAGTPAAAAPLPQIAVYRGDAATLPETRFLLVRAAGCVWLAG